MNRVGIGYDAHRLVAGRKLVLGGVEIPHSHGLEGHSDADVLVHAVCDALLGAAALGDIGRHFPDDEPAWKDADSLQLLTQVVALLQEKGYTVGNIDATVVAEAPRLAGHVEAMRANLAQACSIGVDCVSVKATTSEGMGFCGRGEGMESQAVVLIADNAKG